MSDNEHATAPLGNSEVLSVKDTIGELIPEFPHRSEKGSKVISSVARQDARDIFPNEPTGPQSLSKLNISECQPRTLSSHSRSLSCD
jgi:hypothetical protein